MTFPFAGGILGVGRAIDNNGGLDDLGPKLDADSGAPHTSKLELYADDRLRFGIWECTPGGWRIENRVGTETMLILTGRVLLTPIVGEPTEIGPGDYYVLPHGWSGRWDTLETVRKIYTTS